MQFDHVWTAIIHNNTASQLVNFPSPRISTRVPGAISEIPSLQPPAPQGPVASSYPPPTATRWCPFAPGNWGHLGTFGGQLGILMDPPSGSTCLTCPFQSLKQQRCGIWWDMVGSCHAIHINSRSSRMLDVELQIRLARIFLLQVVRSHAAQPSLIRIRQPISPVHTGSFGFHMTRHTGLNMGWILFQQSHLQATTKAAPNLQIPLVWS